MMSLHVRHNDDVSAASHSFSLFPFHYFRERRRSASAPSYNYCPKFRVNTCDVYATGLKRDEANKGKPLSLIPERGDDPH